VSTYVQEGIAAQQRAASFDSNLRTGMPSDARESSFDRRFLVLDRETKRPLSDIPYRLTLPAGERLIGRTDQAGLTALVSARTALLANIEVPFYGDIASNTDALGRYDACGC
jgi:type VI secretion system secreted protein VgrG